ncbi:MAG: nucleoid occlusion factor SlmA [Burkholderiales bacterium]|nr:nucleoid occlusion factor SlmA [Burkholderiales bacterium]
MPRSTDRKTQILQLIAQMLESPTGEKITTAALAKHLQVSEAALYRHFASKAQMFEGLIEFIESSLFGLINRITVDEADGLKQVHAIVAMTLRFSAQNPGMTRVLIGDALVNENERLQTRINALTERLEAALRQSLRVAVSQSTIPQAVDVTAQANALMCYVIGRWHQFAKSGFRRSPTDGLERQLPLLLG